MDDFSSELKKKKRKERGIPLKRTSIAFAVIMAIISACLVIGLFFNLINYNDLLRVSHNYISWEENAKNMMISSDYLTEQVRSFVLTGDRIHLDNYFVEAEETRRRDKALEYIENNFPNSEAHDYLKEAMKESDALMLTEYRAMRLKCDALGEDLTAYPQAVRDVALTDEEAALSPAQKDARASYLLFSQTYSLAKENISENTNKCLKALVDELDEEQNAAEFRLRFAMIYELVLILAFLFLSFFIVLLTSRQIFDPLINSIGFIENDAPLPVQGSYELRMLAYAYNLMYETNRRNKSRLEFEADHDALTGALNRAAFEDLQETTDVGKVAFLILDVDNFKQINDIHGHLAGDKVLVELVQLMHENFRSNDSIFRIGGDEFAVVLFGIDENSKKIIQNKFAAINDALSESTENGAPQVTISAGVSFGEKIDDELFRQADSALYVSKNSGKSTCSFYKAS